MGILGLKKLIANTASNALKKITVKSLAGLRIGFDASIDVYQLYNIGVKHKIMGTADKPINHIIGTFHRVIKYLTLLIKPVYIFDGSPPKIKAGVIAARRGLHQSGRAVHVPYTAFNDVLKLLQLMKIPTVQAVCEAESHAAVMSALGHIDAVASEDMDTLTFGATRQIIGLDCTATSVISVTLEDTLQGMSLTRAQFIDLCILLGCDYTTATLPRIGPKRGLALIRKHSTIENILVAESITPPEGFTYIEARREFNAPLVDVAAIVNLDKVLTYTEIEIDAISNYLQDNGVPLSRCKAGLDKLRKLNIVG